MNKPKDELSPKARFSPSDGLRLSRFDDEGVVFDPLSWDAHLLNPAAIAVLELLFEAVRSEDEIVAYLAEVLLPEEQSQAPAHAKRLIGGLQSLGLIHPLEAAPSAHR